MRISHMDDRKSPFDVIGQLGALRRYARSLVRNPDDAEDLVQDALMRAYERRPSFRQGANLRTWLMSVLHNTHIDSLRRKRSQTQRVEEAALLSQGVHHSGAEDVVRLGQLREAFFSLPEEQRAALHLVAIDEMSYQDAARVLDIPVGTLMSRLSRARARLRAFEEDRTPTHLKIVGGTDNDHG
ncbi:RNA polymerase sigma-70 factor, ECF subfamily [Rhizobium sp. 9140]|nr:RNA polymerase sigma-70 factor, ECF subfamily [Rhizobium sp. 9140]